MRGPVEQLGCARRPVKAEVAGSNPVGTARTGPTRSPGQVAQSVERAAENRKVGGSIPSLPTTSALVRMSLASAPPGMPTADSGILPALSLTTAATGGLQSTSQQSGSPRLHAEPPPSGSRPRAARLLPTHRGASPAAGVVVVVVPASVLGPCSPSPLMVRMARSNLMQESTAPTYLSTTNFQHTSAYR
jgi:hypothetical protein